MILKTKLKPHRVIEILLEQTDRKIPLLRSILTLNLYAGTSAVIGEISEDGFWLRNRRNPFFAITVYGKVIPCGHGSHIQLAFKKPWFRDFIGDFLFKRSEHDQNVVLCFLKEWLELDEKGEQPIA